MIKISNLTIRYPQVIAIDDISIQLNNGLIYGLIGPNGAGKSSLIRSIVGLISEYDGDIIYDGLSAHKNRSLIKSSFGYAPENPDLYPYLTGREYLQMISEIRKSEIRGEIDYLVADFELHKVIDDLINSYSHGMRQKVSFAAALISRPQNIILDEALNGFDPVSLFNAKKLLKKLADADHTILLSSHVLELLENWCEQIIILHEGKILAVYSSDEINKIKQVSGQSFNHHFISLIKKSAHLDDKA